MAPSTSLALMEPVTMVASLVVLSSPTPPVTLTTAASSVAATLTGTVMSVVPPAASVTRMVKLSLPFQLPSVAVNTKLPLPSTVSVPWWLLPSSTTS